MRRTAISAMVLMFAMPGGSAFGGPPVTQSARARASSPESGSPASSVEPGMWGRTLLHNAKVSQCFNTKIPLQDAAGRGYTAFMAVRCRGQTAIWITADDDGSTVFSETLVVDPQDAEVSSNDFAPLKNPLFVARDLDGDKVPDLVFATSLQEPESSDYEVAAILMRTGEEAWYVVSQRDGPMGPERTFGGPAENPKASKLRAALKKQWSTTFHR